MFRDRTLDGDTAPNLYVFYSIALGFAMWGIARVALIAQAYFFLAPEERFPATLDGYHQAPPYFWGYVDYGAIGLGVFSWGLLFKFFNEYPASWRLIPFLVRKFLLWWGVGLTIGGLAGYAAYTGQLEPFLDSYLPFIWEEKQTFRPGELRETFLPPMAEDAYSALAWIAFQVGVLANFLFYVLRGVFYGLLGDILRLRSDDEPAITVIIRGRPVRRE